MKTRPQTERNTVVYLCARVFGRSPHRPWCRGHRYGRGGGGHLCGRGTGGWQSKNQCFFFSCVVWFCSLFFPIVLHLSPVPLSRLSSFATVASLRLTLFNAFVLQLLASPFWNLHFSIPFFLQLWCLPFSNLHFSFAFVFAFVIFAFLWVAFISPIFFALFLFFFKLKIF